MSLLFRFGRALLAVCMSLWHKIEFEGLENIPDRGGFIVCSNHRTDMDPLYLAWKMKRQLYFMAKAELFRIPVLGFLVKKLEAFPVERGKGDTGAVNYAINIVKTGKILAMFPEGTRSRDGKLLKGKSGISVIASKSGGDVLPVGLKFTEPVRFRSKIVIRYGKIIPNSDLHIEDNKPSDIKAATTRIMSEIASLLED
ncbi:1-acyl-sn-glycerol-3-phosphate acyltransferase [Hydrogenoanaerobacterium saccharovorans]|uniref:1-acyl-sn-glycerol-3-phosphate acyltransferase/cytidylate kinase n=1 Tax=Hydrogenoanaerobacterium saccharovorans TaxID=474960 RepID=A0A1H7ZCZ2_9FIRM|nr:lysophospholipid acyltransferase family protein [Hydrogenoanaerobacterium saccharovorans]RPF48681.1 1-acyl-sn-glycerol-3-phosphate acyltransferase [Hydrogenoanaerobacterium saccharovorans]SEM56186.1 1-acyl-sn-glycerol-3-phosphate acyltransferase/cytidylate kinase [Hydrogenoanaerobacterium saccharovorans]